MNNDVYGFNKNGFLSDSEIEELYAKKSERVEDKKTQDKLFHALMYDPRKSDIYFGSEKDAHKAESVAHKLDAMTTETFISSDYPYQWLDELVGTKICKVTNPDVLNPQTSGAKK
jgi:hypothetical protein